MKDVNILNFVERIQDAGCILAQEISRDDESFHWYLSKHNTRKVCICVSDEDMTEMTANDLLVQLECDELIGFV